MITIIHIIIALGSVAYVTALMFRPTLNFNVAYGSVGATLLSGVLLVAAQPATMTHVCVSGTVYLAVSIGAIVFAGYRKANYSVAS